MQTAWQHDNLAAIAARLAPLRHLPDGMIYDDQPGLHRIQIHKTGSHLQLYFVGAGGALEGPMSRIDLERPLHLQASYTQAALVALIWQPEPRRICALGFAGGRISMLLHHYLPELAIDNVEIDPAFATIAPDYFGIAFDARQRLFIADGRQFLESAEQLYDGIIMDAFRDDSDELGHLATTQFYALCAARLTKNGVLCVNLLRSDEHAAAKIKALRERFSAVLIVELKHSLVVFGSAYQQLGAAEIARRAAELHARHAFEFPFRERAAELRAPRAIDRALLRAIERADALTD